MRRSPRKKTVCIGPDEYRVIRESIGVLADCPNIFVKGDALVRVVEDLDLAAQLQEPARITYLEEPFLRELLTEHINLVEKADGRSRRKCHPPPWLVKGICHRKEWPGIPRLEAVTNFPLLRKDGSVWTKRGYDSVTRRYYSPSGKPLELNPAPTRADAVAAVARLHAVFKDFPLIGNAHRVAILAGVLTPIARSAFRGCAPLLLVNGDASGSGKTKMFHMIAYILIGQEMFTRGYTRDKEELRKQITSIALQGTQMVLIDNITVPFGDSVLDLALTTGRWGDRVLGKLENCESVLQATWYANGNHMKIVGDSARRILYAKMESKHPHPELRDDFDIKDLPKYVLEHRNELLAAAFTILQAYLLAGSPPQTASRIGSFEGWSDLVRAALIWADCEDPWATNELLIAQVDTNSTSYSEFVHSWMERIGLDQKVVLSQLIQELYARNAQPLDEASCNLRAAIEAIAGTRPGSLTDTQALANRLRALRRREVDGMKLDVVAEERQSAGQRWVLRAIGGPEL